MLVHLFASAGELHILCPTKATAHSSPRQEVSFNASDTAASCAYVPPAESSDTVQRQAWVN